MDMKKWLLLSLIMGAMPLSMTAQDDMYFVPTKERVAKESAKRMVTQEPYYSGINRSVDDRLLARRGSLSRLAGRLSAGTPHGTL